MKAKYLVLGAGGQLGKEFSSYLKNHDQNYLAPAEKESDITNQAMMQKLIMDYNPDYIINCAAYNAVDKAEEDKDTALLVNGSAPGGLAEMAAGQKIKMVHFSSDYVFDGNKNDLYQENDDCKPVNVYGKSKLKGELQVLSKGDHLVMRLSWVIGPGEQNFIYKLNQWSRNNPVLKITSDEVSVPTFTFDIVEVTMKALQENLHGLYHLTSSDYASRYELTRHYLKISGRNNVVIPVPMSHFQTPAKRPLFSAMSNQKLKDTLDIGIPSWQESLEKYVKLYLGK
ncbi:MAG: dTDP-4-dehydrorhamnose reductase [Cyclobacteriaceae bacterium]